LQRCRTPRIQRVEVFQEEKPRGLLGVVEFGRTAGFFPENVVDVFEGLFENDNCSREILRLLLNALTGLIAGSI
jgi:hypothetical protein